MENYGYTSVRKTVEELRSLPTPRSGITTNMLRQAEKRLIVARMEYLEKMPVEELDALIDAYQAKTRADGEKQTAENLQEKASAIRMLNSNMGKGAIQ